MLCHLIHIWHIILILKFTLSLLLLFTMVLWNSPWCCGIHHGASCSLRLYSNNLPPGYTCGRDCACVSPDTSTPLRLPSCYRRWSELVLYSLSLDLVKMASWIGESRLFFFIMSTWSICTKYTRVLWRVCVWPYKRSQWIYLRPWALNSCDDRPKRSLIKEAEI